MSLIAEPSDRIKWIVNTGTAELIQALHRVRPVKGGRTIIVIGKEFPAAEFGQPAFRLNKQRRNQHSEPAIDEITHRLSPVIDAFGIMTKAVGWMFGVCLSSDIDKMTQAHEMIQKNIENGNLEYEKKYQSYLKTVSKSKKYTKGQQPNSVSLYGIFREKRYLPAILFYPFLILQNRSTWESVLRLFAEKFDLPNNFSAGSTRPSRGIGYLSDVQAFYESLNANFNPAQWTGTKIRKEQNA
jgi:hypothetical protein